MARLVTLDGATYFSTPDNAALRITASLDVSADIAPTDATPSSINTIVGNNVSNDGYLFRINSGGTVVAAHGSGVSNRAESSSLLGLSDGVRRLIRYTANVTTGDCIWYAAGAEADTDSMAAAAGSPTNGVVTVGAAPDGSAQFTGSVFSVTLLDDIAGSTVACVDAADIYATHGYGALANGATWVGSVDGLTWTVNGTGASVGIDITSFKHGHNVAGPGQLLHTGG